MTYIESMSLRRALVLCAVFVAVILLGGCASLDRAGLWLGDGVRDARTQIASLLRPAPKDVAVFAYDNGDASLNTGLLEARVLLATLPRTEPDTVQQVIDRTRDNGVTVYRPTQQLRRQLVRQSRSAPQMWRQPAARPAVRPAPTYQPSPTPAPAPITEQSAADPYAYVNLSGPTNMADWTVCDQQVGGAFIVTPAEVSIAPEFDACLRAKGYVPESEAQERLAGGPDTGLLR